MGMFLPAFFTGHLIQRFGIFNIMTAGIALLIGGVAIALLGTTEWHFRGALGLNGVGWNFLFVGGTALLTETYRPEERARAQGFNDLAMFTLTAIASFSSGLIMSASGWNGVNLAALPFIGSALAAVAWLALRTRTA
jgi:MFS family permease